jgi:hypothetical protein
MENLDVKQSIKTIEQAIQEARKVPNGAYFYDILWGVILTLYYFLNYISLSYPDSFIRSFNNYYWIVFPIGGILSSIRSMHDGANEKAKSFADKIYLFSYSGFAFAYITIYLAAEFNGLNNIVVPFFCSLLGLTVFVTGGIVGETLSIVVGIIGMFIGAFILKLDVSHQCLYASIVCIVACVIPGIKMMWSRV